MEHSQSNGRDEVEMIAHDCVVAFWFYFLWCVDEQDGTERKCGENPSPHLNERTHDIEPIEMVVE